MAKVLGIGGVFFKAADPQAVRDWYVRVLGFDINDWGGVTWPDPPVGHGIWSVFEASNDYFSPSDASFMINFVVDDLEGVLAKAKAAGAEPVGEPVNSEYGRFGWLMDPAGVKIELWEPPATPDAT
ncbi:MAG TPA: VOC family protein [Phenylobacterium sp.]|jgi:predicted enzyme related to lactoylglutathione lyase|nr:VOC family protein [Phenylobacterium sp.]